MDIPEREFVDELYLRRERHRGKDSDWPRLISEGIREVLHSQYFPYNCKITRALLRDKHVMMIGDSLVRAMYKDLIALIHTGDLCKPHELRVSNERSFYGDKQIDFLDLAANRVFRQAREFQSNRHLIQYFFTNRTMREDLEKTCMVIEATDEKPDIVIMHSAIWDVSRFPARHTQRYRGDKNTSSELEEEINVAEEYFHRVAMFCRRMSAILPPSSTLVWLLMPPSTSPEVERGFMHHNHLTFDEIRARTLDANVRVAQIVREAGFDVLDLSFHFRSSNYAVFRIKDGVHWNVVATRFMTQLLMGHLTTAWRLERSVTKKWPVTIQQRTYPKDKRTRKLTTALEFLKDVNSGKQLNEFVHQDVRLLTLDKFAKENEYDNPGHMTMENLIVQMRTLLMVHKYGNKKSDQLKMIGSAFRVMPSELSMFSQEDIQNINLMIDAMCDSWRNTRWPPFAVGSSSKRKLELGGRRALLPTPPGITAEFHRSNSIPNRIADPAPRYPPAKRSRQKNWHH